MKLYRDGNTVVFERKSGFLSWLATADVIIQQGSGGEVVATAGYNSKTEETRVVLPADIEDANGNNPFTTFDEAVQSLLGAVETSTQSQITPPLDSLCVESLSNFTLSADTVLSTVSTLVYTFEATAGHGISTGNEIILLDVAGDRSLQAVVINVVTNTITVDRPIDHVYPSATTLGRITNSNMNVIGSLASPRIFTLRGGLNPSDYTRFLLTMTDDSAMDDGRFGGISALTNGLVLRVISDFQRTIFNFKTNQDINQFCYDTRYSPKAPSGLFGFSGRLSFEGADKHGVPLRLTGLQVIQWVVQDDLTELLSLRVAGQGQETEGEQ